MKQHFVAAIAVIGLSVGSACAAELPVKAAPAPRAPKTTYNWTGLYLGGFVGGAWGKHSSAPDPSGCAGVVCGGYIYGTSQPPNTYNLGSSVIGGLTAGYNYQFASNWVTGIEVESGYIHLKGSSPFATTAGAPQAGESVATTKVGDWYGAFTGRLGYVWNNVLLYGKAGAAVVREKTTVIDVTASVPNPGLLDAEGSKTVWGAALGGGLEWAFAQNWSVKAEYLYLGVNHTIQSCGVDTGVGSIGFGGTFCSNVSVPAVQTAKVGLNYYFH